MFIIKKCGQKKYVTPPNSAKSYTPYIEKARKYNTRDDAIKDLCPENEVIVDIYIELGI